MKKFVDKLIESFLGECVIYAENYEKALNIANELTEEYINTSTDTSTTNADRIRGMTDEELAEFLCEISMCKPDYCPAYDKCMRTEHGTMKGWLQSEVEGLTENE